LAVLFKKKRKMLAWFKSRTGKALKKTSGMNWNNGLDRPLIDYDTAGG